MAIACLQGTSKTSNFCSVASSASANSRAMAAAPRPCAAPRGPIVCVGVAQSAMACAIWVRMTMSGRRRHGPLALRALRENPIIEYCNAGAHEQHFNELYYHVVTKSNQIARRRRTFIKHQVVHDAWSPLYLYAQTRPVSASACVVIMILSSSKINVLMASSFDGLFLHS